MSRKIATAGAQLTGDLLFAFERAVEQSGNSSAYVRDAIRERLRIDGYLPETEKQASLFEAVKGALEAGVMPDQIEPYLVKKIREARKASA